MSSYYGVDHDSARSAEERALAARMKLLRQRMRDSLLLQTKALCVLMFVGEEGKEVAMSSESESGGGGGSSSSSSAQESPSAKAFIASASNLRRYIHSCHD